MKCVIRAIGWADGRPCPFAGMWLRSFDFDAAGGQGVGDWTRDKARARHFQSVAGATAFWRTQSKAVPLRPDGKPNRPLTAITVTFDPAEP